MSEPFPLDVKESVQPVYSEFDVDAARLTAFATDLEGPLSLSEHEVGLTLVQYDGDPRVLSYRSTSPGIIQNLRDHISLKTTRVSVGTRTFTKSRTPEEIEKTTIHELVHVRQLKRGAMSLKIGLFMQKVGLIGGALGLPAAIEAITNRDLHTTGIVASGLFGAISGWLTAYQLSPHEIEARRVAKATPYMGIVTGTINPAYESFKEKEDRKNAESWAKLLERLDRIHPDAENKL